MRGFLVGRHRACAFVPLMVTLLAAPPGGAFALPIDTARAHAAARQPRTEPLRGGALLIAGERLRDPNFARTVVLLIEHDGGGAFGVIIDRPIGIDLSQLTDLSREPEAARSLAHAVSVYRGGPVEPTRVTLLLRATTPPPDALSVLDGVYVSLSRRAFEWAAEASLHPGRIRAYLGYAGWGPGQLDTEFENGDWHLIDATPDAIFSANETELWKRLIQQARGTWVRQGGPTRAEGRAGRPEPRLPGAGGPAGAEPDLSAPRWLATMGL